MGGFLAESVAGDLFDLGDWEESDRVLAEALEHQTVAAGRLQTIKGFLEVGRGDFRAAREHLELTRRLSPSPFQGTWPHSFLAILAIHKRRYDAARAAVDEAVGILDRLEPDDRQLFSADAVDSYVVGLWVEADCAELARAERSAAGVDEARRRAGTLLAALRAVTGQPDLTVDTEDGWLACYAAQAEAELSRLEGRPNPSCGRQRCGARRGSSCCHIGLRTTSSDRPRRCLRPRRRTHGSNRCWGPHTRRR